MDVLVPEVLFYYGVVNRHVLLCIVDTKNACSGTRPKVYTVFRKKHPLVFSFITSSQINQFAQTFQHL